MKGLETARNKDKFVTALVTTLLGWRLEEQPDHSFNPKKPKYWLPDTCAGAQLEHGDDIDAAPKLCVSG